MCDVIKVVPKQILSQTLVHRIKQQVLNNQKENTINPLANSNCFLAPNRVEYVCKMVLSAFCLFRIFTDQKKP